MLVRAYYNFIKYYLFSISILKCNNSDILNFFYLFMLIMNLLILKFFIIYFFKL